MHVYAVVLISLFLVLVLTRELTLRWQIKVCLLCVAVLTAFATLRGHVGTDTYAYHLLFADNSDQEIGDLLAIVEPLFALLIGFIAKWTTDSIVFLIAIALFQGLLLAHLTKTSKSPVDFLLVYLAIFYLSFQFNVLRAGTAILLLLMANRVPHDAPRQGKFYFFGIAAIFSHYSALVAFLPLLLWRLRSSNPRAIVGTIIVILAASFYVLVISKDILLGKYLLYTDLLAPDVANSSSTSFIVGLPIYLAIFATAVNKKNAVGLVLGLVTWIAFRWLTTVYSLAGRVEMIANALFLFYMIETHAAGWRKILRSASISALATMWIVGTLVGLSREDSILANLGVVDVVYLSSPFTPYHFIWDIK